MQPTPTNRAPDRPPRTVSAVVRDALLAIALLALVAGLTGGLALLAEVIH